MFPKWSTTPLPSWGLIHILSILVMLCCIVVGVILGRKYSYAKHKKTVDKVLFTFGITLLVLEILKQIYLTVAEGSYDLSKIPFQICSIPIYILSLWPIFKTERAKKATYNYVSYFSMCAATFYFVKPSAILSMPYILMSIHSLIWHASLSGLGAFCIAASNPNFKEDMKGFADAYVLFVLCSIVAIIANTIFNKVLGQPIVDLFYINSQNKAFYPLLNLLYKMPRPYPVYVVSFWIYFGLGGLFFYGMGALVRKVLPRK